MTSASDDPVHRGAHASADGVKGRGGPQEEAEGILSSVRVDY